MWISLLPLCLTGLVLLYGIKRPAWGWRMALLLAAATLMVAGVLFLELFSLFSAVTPFITRLFWSAFLIGIAALLFRRVRRGSFHLPQGKKLKGLDLVFAVLLVLVFLVNALVAFVAPPNTWDSMTYHLPRVMHWAVNNSVHFYPTYTERQLFFCPGAEFGLFHTFLLGGDDRWFNFLQWSAWVGSAVSVSLLARYLGANQRGQLLAALFTATIPMAVLQSTSTQNDLFMAFWAAVAVAIALALREKFSKTCLYGLAGVVGICLLVKGTFFLPLVFLVWILARFFSLPVLKHVILALCLLLLLVGGHYIRTLAWPYEQTVVRDHQQTLMQTLIMKSHAPRVVLMNGVCHLATQFQTPYIPGYHWINRIVYSLAAGLNVDLRDTKIFAHSFIGPPGPMFVFDEDYASSPLHVVLILLLPLLLWLLRPSRDVWLYGGCLLIGALIFISLIQWQPWCTRLQLPLLILAAPLIGVAYGRWTAVFIGVAVVVLAYACATIAFHQTRSLFGHNRLMQMDRKVYYFMKRPGLIQPYAQAAAIIRSSGCRDVGLMDHGESWEYPLWALTGYGEVSFRSIGLPGVEKEPLPCLAVALDTLKDGSFKWQDVEFKKVWEQKSIQIFVPARR